MIGAIAEFERNLILERQREGIAIAKKKGVYKGRKGCLAKVNESFKLLQVSLRHSPNRTYISRRIRLSPDHDVLFHANYYIPLSIFTKRSVLIRDG